MVRCLSDFNPLYLQNTMFGCPSLIRHFTGRAFPIRFRGGRISESETMHFDPSICSFPSFQSLFLISSLTDYFAKLRKEYSIHQVRFLRGSSSGCGAKWSSINDMAVAKLTNKKSLAMQNLHSIFSGSISSDALEPAQNMRIEVAIPLAAVCLLPRWFAGQVGA